MSESIALAGPVPRQGPQSFLAFLRTLRDNSIATFGEVAFEEPFFETRTFWRRVLLVHDPAGIKHVLLDNAENYGRTELTRRLLEPGLGHGLLTSEGETWRRHRRIMAPSFHHRAIQSYVPVMTEVAEGLAGEWGSLAPGAEIDVARAMMHATLHIISKTMFSQDSDDIVDVVERGVEQYQAKIRPTFFDMIGLPRWFPRFAAKRVADAALGEFDRSIDRLLSARREGMDAGANPDLLTRLMSARDEETGGGMSAGEIRDQVVTIFMAGHETTALALSWVWYLLALHPEAEAKLHAELDTVLGGRTPHFEDIAKLPYTRMVIDEAMRLYPPAHTLSRAALGADEIGGHKVHKGSTVIIAPWVLHRHRLLWDAPLRFDPERFTPERVAERPRYAYLPFGAGPRICIGAAFAVTEAVLLLATLASRFRLRLVPGHPIEPQALITLRPRYGIKVVVERR